jgi:hypothetical protein
LVCPTHHLQSVDIGVVNGHLFAVAKKKKRNAKKM